MLTIIMPVYNAKETLPQALQGILNQTYKDLEILLVDDGSTDGINEIIDEILGSQGGMDERIQVITQQHAGASAARNAALQIASGRYVYFADADDVMEPDAARVMVRKMENPGTDLLTFGFRQINRETGEKKEFSAEERRFSGEEIRMDYTKWTSDSPCKVLGSCWNKCFRMDLIKEFGISFPDLSRNEEEVFIMRYIDHVQDVYNIPDVLYNFYPINLQQAWKRLPKDYCEQVEQFRRERMSFARMWSCDTQKTREFIASEYWGKMMLGLRLCFAPGKKTGRGEFSRRCRMILKGLSATGSVPEKIAGSTIYKCMKRNLTPLVKMMVKRSCR